MEEREKLIAEAQKDGIVIYDNNYQRFQCRICEKPMSGIISVGDHLANSKHTETAARIAIKDIRNNVPASLLRVLSSEVKAAAEEGIIEVVVLPGGCPGILCKVCDKPLTGLAPLQQHLQGSDHRKKLGRSHLATYPQSPSGGHNTWNQVQNGVASNINYQAPHVGSHVAPIGHQVPYNAASNTQNPVPYTRSQVPNAWNQTQMEVPSHAWNQVPEEIISQSSNQMQSGIASNTWSQIPNARSQEVPNSWNQVPTGTVSNRTLWTGNPVIPSRNPKEITQPSTLSSPLPFASTGALPRSTHPQFLSGASTSVMQPQMENRLGIAATLSSLEEEDDRIIRYNTAAMKHECLVCRLPILGDSRGIDDHLMSKSHKEEGAKYAIENSDHVPRCLVDLLPRGAIEAARAGILYINQNRAFQCRPCDKIFTGVPPLKEHMVSFDHRKRTDNLLLEQQAAAQHILPSDDAVMYELTKAFEEGVVVCTDNSSDQVMCNVCNVTLNGNKNLQDHLNGKKHQKKEMLLGRHNQNAVPQSNRTEGNQNNLRRSPESPGIEPTLDREPSKPTENTEEIHPALMPYRVSSVPRGQVHIFNYLFVGRTKDPKERKGAPKDSIRLMNTFSSMRYQVFCHEDLTRDETIKKLDQIRCDKELDQVDVLVMFFLSHGNQPFMFYAFDGHELGLREIWDKFTDSACPAMKKKPKIFFANFCRGMDEEMSETDAKIDVPRDMVTIHASSERVTALRSPTYGTHFVRALCKILENDARNLDLREIYHKLDVEVKVLGGRQPKWEDSRFRKFYF